MRVSGHLVEVEWDGAVLRARATNADGRALLAAGTEDGRLVLPAAEIAAVSVRDAPRRVGGLLLVTATSGAEHRLHYRRDSLEAFHALADELDAAARPFRPVADETPDVALVAAPADGDLEAEPARDVDTVGVDLSVVDLTREVDRPARV